MSSSTRLRAIYQVCISYFLRHWSPKVVVGTICISIAGIALAATGVMSSEKQAVRAPSDPWEGFLVPTSGKISIDADVSPGYAPIAVVRIGDQLFEKLVLQDSPQATASGPGGGFADVFDSDGRLLRRFTAVERLDSTWQIIQYVRLSAYTSTP